MVYHQDYPEGCNAYVVHRPGTTATDVNDLFFVGVHAPSLDQERRCALATELATTVEEQLPSMPAGPSPRRRTSGNAEP